MGNGGWSREDEWRMKRTISVVMAAAESEPDTSWFIPAPVSNCPTYFHWTQWCTLLDSLICHHWTNQQSVFWRYPNLWKIVRILSPTSSPQGGFSLLFLLMLMFQNHFYCVFLTMCGLAEEQRQQGCSGVDHLSPVAWMKKSRTPKGALKARKKRNSHIPL